MSDKTYTCTNHPNLRWFTTSGRHLYFAGELPTDEHPTGRPKWEGGTAMGLFRARFEGYNPFLGKDYPGDDTEPSITTWEDIVHHVEWVQQTETRWVFECECPPDLLIEVDEDNNEMLGRIHLAP